MTLIEGTKVKRRGFTLAELLVASVVALFTFSSTISVFIMLQKFWQGGNSQVHLQSRARIAMDHIIHYGRSALEAQVLNNGNTLRLRLDPNGTESQSDDIWCQYDFANNNLTFTPNIAFTGTKTILQNVYQASGRNMFNINGTNVGIVFETRDPSGLFGHKGTYMESSVTLRNSYAS